jgi:hypothetical protein
VLGIVAMTEEKDSIVIEEGDKNTDEAIDNEVNEDGGEDNNIAQISFRLHRRFSSDNG